MDVNVKDKQQKHVECRQRNNSMLRGKQEERLDAHGRVSTHKGCTDGAKAVQHTPSENQKSPGRSEGLQQMTKQLHPTDFATEFRGIGPYLLLLTM